MSSVGSPPLKLLKRVPGDLVGIKDGLIMVESSSKIFHLIFDL